MRPFHLFSGIKFRLEYLYNIGFQAVGADIVFLSVVKWTGYVLSYVYWSAVEYAPNTNNAWAFNTNNGNQNNNNKNNEFYAWAVRSGVC